MLHGYPNNHVLWHAIAGRLAQRYHVVCPICAAMAIPRCLIPGPNLVNYSHRVMAEDMIDIMAQLGHQRFYLLGHDRGARVSHRMCLGPPGTRDEAFPARHAADLLRLDQHDRGMGARHLALGVPGPARTVSRRP
jgi:hypothetical protein